MAIHVTELPIKNKAIAALKLAISLGLVITADLAGTAAATIASATTRIGKIHIADQPALAPLSSAITYANATVPAQFSDNTKTTATLLAALQAA